MNPESANAIRRGIAIVEATIASGASLSGAVDLGGASLLAVYMPSGWDAAALTFQAGDTEGGTYQNVYTDAGSELSATVAASRVVVPGGVLENLSPVRFLKLRSGTAAVPVNQTANRTLKLLVKG